MAISKELRTKIEAELQLGKTPKELSKKYNVNYQTINSWKKKLQSKEVEKDIEELRQVDEHTLKLVAEKVKSEAPKEVAEKVDKLIDGVIGLQQLEPKFHAIVFELLSWAEDKLQENLTVRDWATISKTISDLYSAIFNKNNVQVNVLNNTTIHSEKRKIFNAKLGV